MSPDLGDSIKKELLWHGSYPHSFPQNQLTAGYLTGCYGCVRRTKLSYGQRQGFDAGVAVRIFSRAYKVEFLDLS